MSVSGHLPSAGERIDCGNWRFEIVALDGKRIDKVLASAREAPAANEGERAGAAH